VTSLHTAAHRLTRAPSAAPHASRLLALLLSLSAALVCSCAGGPALKDEPKPAAAGAAKTGAGARAAVEGPMDANAGAAVEAAASAERARPEQGPVTPDADFRQARPEPAATQPSYTAPVPVELKLKSGARLLVVESRAVPLVSIEVLIAIGADGEAAGKSGLASFTAEMLREGTKKHPSQRLAEELDDLAARLTSSAGQETSRVRLNCLKETLPKALDLLADLLVNPSFEPADLERVRGLLLTELVQNTGSPAALAANEVARIAWGEKHPWGQPAGGTPESVRALTRDDLVRFHEAWYRPGNAILSVAGDVSPAEIQRLLETRLAGWKGKAPPRPKLPAAPDLGPRAITLVDKPGGSQSQVWVFGRGVAANHPDRVALRLANTILGGSFLSRLNQNLREAKGYSYGVRMALPSLREHGLWTASGSIKVNLTAEALTEYEKELAAFATGELRPGELERAKEQAVRSLPGALETVDAVAASMAMLAFHGLPLDEYKRLPEKIAAVDTAEVSRVVKAWLHPERMPVVIVGPAAQSAEKLQALGLGPVEVRAVAQPEPAAR
jgi:zinc protease